MEEVSLLGLCASLCECIGIEPPKHAACKIDSFVGAMTDDAGQDTVPYMYAMKGTSNINNERQEKVWIICHSG